MDTSKEWTELVEDMTELPDVAAGKMFGCLGLKTGKKFFAMVWEDKLVVKLPKDRAAKVMKSGGEAFQPMPGRTMGEWVVVANTKDWPTLAEESRVYVEKLAAG